MFAVIKTGGKQYKAAKGEVLAIEKLEHGVGSVVVFDQVLSVTEGTKITIGAPVVEGVQVAAEILEQKRGEKVLVFKKRRRHNYRRKNGHRQYLTIVRITEIGSGLKANLVAVEKDAPATEAKAPKAKKEAAPKAEKAEKTSKAAAPKKAAAKETTKKTTTKAKKAAE
jgi:large subunit ribosomal protein L21